VEQLWESNITEKLPDFSSFLSKDDADGRPGTIAQVHMLHCTLPFHAHLPRCTLNPSLQALYTAEYCWQPTLSTL
jgi:hypothetical protein